MQRAIALAERSAGHTRPNPPVGAVVVKRGRVIGEGRHRRCGGDHAEVAALKSCTSSPKGATVYVTLEPCSKPGRVGACCDALIAAGVQRVVWACPDPNPVNRGKAARILRRAGIETAHGVYADEASVVIRPFAKHVTTGLPYVTVKLAMSLDGKICDDWGDAKWVSSPRARKATCALRSHVDVMLVGAETVRRDNPSLLARPRPNRARTPICGAPSCRAAGSCRRTRRCSRTRRATARSSTTTPSRPCATSASAASCTSSARADSCSRGRSRRQAS